MMEIELQGERLKLLPEKALVWSAQQTLVITDVHLGKAAAFRAEGIPVPRGTTKTDLERLTKLVQAHQPERLLCLGDLIHAKASKTAAVIEAFVTWQQQFKSLDIVLLEGNHDFYANGIPTEWGVQVEKELAEPPFLWRHFPHEPDEPTYVGYLLAGHLHPAVHLPRIGRLPCFYFGKNGGILPAFGSFTGTGLVSAKRGERIVVVADEELIELAG